MAREVVGSGTYRADRAGTREDFDRMLATARRSDVGRTFLLLKCHRCDGKEFTVEYENGMLLVSCARGCPDSTSAVRVASASETQPERTSS